MTDQQDKNQDVELPEGMTRIFIGLLKKGPTWSPDATPEIMENQRKHLELLSALGASGDLLIAGPTPDGSDLRGILVIQADSLEAAKEHFAEDAHIRSDRLILEVHPWYVQRELLEQPLLR